MNISLHYCGPLPSGDYLVVIVDEYFSSLLCPTAIRRLLGSDRG